MYSIFATSQFKKDLKKAKRSGLNIAELQIVVDCLAKGEELDTKVKSLIQSIKITFLQEIIKVLESVILDLTGC